MRPSTVLVLVLATLAFASANNEASYLKKMFRINTAKMVTDSVEFTPSEIDAYVLQFLKGLKADQYVANSTACISATKNTTIALMTTFGTMMSSNTTDKLAAYFNFTQAIGMISPWMRMCYNSSDTAILAFINHLKSFKTANVFMQQFFANAMGKGFTINGAIGNFNAASNNGNMTEASYQLGRILRLLFEFQPPYRMTVSQAVPHDPFDGFEWVIDLANSFLQGARIISHVQNMSICHDASMNLDLTFRSAISTYANSTLPTSQRMREGTFKIFDLFTYVYPISYHCYYAGFEVMSNAAAYKDILNHPTRIAYHIIYNFGTLWDDAAMAYAGVKTWNATQMGHYTGDMAYRLFFLNQ